MNLVTKHASLDYSLDRKLKLLRHVKKNDKDYVSIFIFSWRDFKVK